MKKTITTSVIVVGIVLSLNAFTVTQNDGRFVSGKCDNGDTFFIEKKGPMYEGSGTSAVCTKSSLRSAIQCVCREY